MTMEVTGTMVGIAGLAGIFTSCVDCFDYIRIGRNFGEDYETCVLRLDIAQLRIIRWGCSVGLTEDSEVIPFISASSNEMDTAKRLLGKVQKHFEQARETSQEYGADVESSCIPEPCNESRQLESRFQRLSMRLHESAAKYMKKSTSVSKAAAWGIYRKRIFDRMVEDITELVDQLINIFPATSLNQQIVAAEQIAPIKDAEDLQLLGELARAEDPLLEKAIKQQMILQGSVYNNVESRNTSRIHAGDVLEHVMRGPSHTYNGGGTRDDSNGHFGNVYQG